MILIIERDKDIGECLCSLLREWGIECELSESFDEAIQKITDGHFQKILIDIGMNLKQANWFVNACKAYYDDTSIVVMSASNPKTLEAYAADMGINKYLCKPFDLDKMQQLLLH